MQGPIGFCNWNEYNLNLLTSNNWRASLVPAAAVIPAPIAYIKVAAVKKLVVGLCGMLCRFLFASRGGLPKGCTASWRVQEKRQFGFSTNIILAKTRGALHCGVPTLGFATFTLKKLECSKRGIFA